MRGVGDTAGSPPGAPGTPFPALRAQPHLHCQRLVPGIALGAGTLMPGNLSSPIFSVTYNQLLTSVTVQKPSAPWLLGRANSATGHFAELPMASG